MPHTPGPWEIEKDTLTVIADGELVAMVAFHSKHSRVLEDLGNASLIAAAPQLLKAAEGVIDAWNSGDLAAAVRVLSHAINKAKGTHDHR